MPSQTKVTATAIAGPLPPGGSARLQVGQTQIRFDERF